jgi:hypothetical protein
MITHRGVNNTLSNAACAFSSAAASTHISTLGCPRGPVASVPYSVSRGCLLHLQLFLPAHDPASRSGAAMAVRRFLASFR